MTTEADTARAAERYQLGEFLGRGGMAAVYCARDTITSRDVALKQLLVLGAASPTPAQSRCSSASSTCWRSCGTRT